MDLTHLKNRGGGGDHEKGKGQAVIANHGAPTIPVNQI